MAVQNQRTQQGIVNEDDLKNTMYGFLTYNSYSRQAAIDAIDGISSAGPNMLDFLGRRIMAQREPAQKIIQDMIYQGIIRRLNHNNTTNNTSPNNQTNGQSSENPANQRPSQQNNVRPLKQNNSKGKKTEQKQSPERNPLFIVKGDPFGRAYDQFRIYGGKSALQISVMHDKNVKDGIDCIMLSFAGVDASKGKKNGKSQFGWEKAIQFALSDVEAICVANLIMGHQNLLRNPTPVRKDGGYEYSEGIYHKSPSGSYKSLRGKYLNNGDQYMPPNSAQLTIISNQDTRNGKPQSIHVNVTIPDRMRLSSFILSRLKKTATYRGLDASEILAISREMM